MRHFKGKKAKLASIATAVTLLLGSLVPVSVAANEKPTMPKKNNVQATIYYGGDILTMTGDSPHYVESVVEKNGSIVFVGTKQAAIAKYGATLQVDLQGKTLLPGFVDAHMHPVQGASMIMPKFATPFDWKFPWGDAKAVRGNKTELLAKIREYNDAETDPDKPLVVWGYLPAYQGWIERNNLDDISTSRPIIVWSYSAHAMLFNTAALKKFRLTAEQVKGNDQVDYEAGLYREAGMIDVAVPRVASVIMDPKNVAIGLERLRQLITLAGVTTVGDMGTGSAGSLKSDYAQIKSVLDNDKTPFRMRLVPDVKTLDIQVKNDTKVLTLVDSMPKYNSEHMLFGKQVKLYADGAFFDQAMQLNEPGYKDGHHGLWLMNPDRLRTLIKFWWKNGYDIHVHCNGSKALEFLLDSIDEAKRLNPNSKDQRFIIEHFGVSSESQVKRMAKLGVYVSANPYYLYSMADNYQTNLGEKEASEIVRLGTLRKNNVRFALHSDFSMAPLDPLNLAWIAVNRKTALGNEMAPSEKISVYDALKAITIDAAFMLRLENKIGSIEEGKKADFVILEENPLKINPKNINEIKIVNTVFEGKTY